MAESNDFKALHRLIRFISDLAVHSFFHEVRIIGGENVPRHGPIIVYVHRPSSVGLAVFMLT
jgi:glycerol-3-phosphate O-acyltransferase/dihydroxyacetone phosphate acyltransferase